MIESVIIREHTVGRRDSKMESAKREGKERKLQKLVTRGTM
jgi:hypothetical protein